MVFSSAKILEAIVGGAIVVDRHQEVKFLNAEAQQMLEISAEKGEGLHLKNVLGDRTEIANAVERVLKGSQPTVESDLIMRRRYSNDIQVELSVSPIGENLEPEGCLVTLRDLTPQKTLLRKNTEREKHESFGKIATGLAHEIKNPLSGIRGAAELLKARTKKEKSRSLAELIVEESMRIDRLVDDLMVFGSGEKLSPQKINIHKIVDKVLRLTELDPIGSDIVFVRNYDPSIPEFWADPDRLTQIFVNLIQNACQVLNKEQSKQITLITKIEIDHRIANPGESPLQMVSISVAANGPGFPEEILPKATTPFVTSRIDGTGLGLAISEYWTNLHGGTFSIRNGSPDGARVSVTLPLRTS